MKPDYLSSAESGKDILSDNQIDLGATPPRSLLPTHDNGLRLKWCRFR